MSRPEFSPFPKIPRLRRTIIVTEKIDGTNAQVVVTDDGEVFAASRTRYITPENDNYGFARWVKENESVLKELGPGQHFGEWWGSGIQRQYGKSGGLKHFSLFNTHRWSRKDELPATHPPVCCGVVPVLYIGPYSDTAVEEALTELRLNGSFVPEARGFMQPEGVVVYMQSSGTMHKVLLEGDELPKGFLVKAERDREEVACGAV